MWTLLDMMVIGRFADVKSAWTSWSWREISGGKDDATSIVLC